MIRLTDILRNFFARNEDYSVLREFCYAKIHRCRVTEANLEYLGSVTIDKALLRAAGISPYTKVDVVNITRSSSQRVTTYAIEGPEHSGVFCLNGAAAHHFSVGDIAIVMAYEAVPVPLLSKRTHTVVHIDAASATGDALANRIENVTCHGASTGAFHGQSPLGPR